MLPSMYTESTSYAEFENWRSNNPLNLKEFPSLPSKTPQARDHST